MSEVNEMNRIFALSQKVYADLADPLSRNLFAARMQYNLTNDVKYLFNMVEMSQTPAEKKTKLKSFRDRLLKISKQNDVKLIIYGAGAYGKYLHNLFTEPDWYAFCDKDSKKQGTAYCNLPVISFEELVINHKNDFIVISSPFIYEEAYKELQTAGFPINQIIFEDVNSAIMADALSMDPSQYFEASIITPQSNEVFIDAGCFDCGTSLLFRKWCGGNYDKIFAFEPDPKNYEKCQSVINQEKIQNIELLNAGAWSRDDQLQFDLKEYGSSSIDSEGAISIQVRSIDNVLLGARATFIKMDIEGAELEALKGARETIAKHRPKLAVCVYHKPEDLLEIQLYLQSLVPDYKFYIRHYSNFSNETILYAV